MGTFKYFEQEGTLYRLKIQKGLYYGLALFLLIVLAGVLVYSHTKGTTVLAVALVFLIVLVILRTTAKMSFDTSSRKMVNQTFFFKTPREYHFDEFDHFLITKGTNMMITINVTAIMIFRKNGKEKRILLRQGFFFTRPMQRLTEELSDIMGLTQ